MNICSQSIEDQELVSSICHFQTIWRMHNYFFLLKMRIIATQSNLLNLDYYIIFVSKLSEQKKHAQKKEFFLCKENYKNTPYRSFDVVF